MNLRKLILVFFCLFLGSTGWAQPSDDFHKAGAAISSGDDHAALEVLQRINGSDELSFGSLYNEGLAWRNLDDLPRSRAAFERALIFSPHDLSTRRRIREIKGRLDPKQEWVEAQDTPWWTMAQAQFLLLFPGLIMVLWGLVGKLRKQPTSPTVLAGFTLVGLTLSALIFWTAPPTNRAVVIASQTQLLPEPHPDKTGEKIPAGELVEIIGRQQHFVEIRLGTGKTGWVRDAQLAELNLPAKSNGNPPPEAQKDERSVPVLPIAPRESPSR